MATEMSPAESVSEGSIRVGYTRRGRRAPLVLGFLNQHGATSIGSDGTIEEIPRSTFDRMASVEGVNTARSLCAALLVAAPIAYGVLDGSTMSGAIVARTVAGRIATARRAASELARIGAVDRVDALPLSPHERMWWKACGYLRLEDFNAAVAQLEQLPPDGYSDATGLLFRCVNGVDPHRRVMAEETIRRRLQAHEQSGGARAAAQAANSDPAPWAWLDDPAVPVPETMDPAFQFSSVSLLSFLLRGEARQVRLTVPEGTSLAVLDDAIALGAVPISDSSSGLAEHDVSYLRARTEPEQLTDDDVAILNFDSERRRRRLWTAVYTSSDAPQDEQGTGDDYLAGLTAVAQGLSPNAAVRQAQPELSAAIERFLHSPDEAGVVDRLALDASLWLALGKHLGDEATGWNPPRGSSSRRFLAWHALRVACEHLMEARWQPALAAMPFS